MAFTEDEAPYLKSQPLARIATVGPDGQPDVTPVSFEFDGTYFYLGGWAPEQTRRFRNVKAGHAKVALVVDDLVSVDPWTLRFLRVYGTAELVEREGRFGPARYMRITPEISWSWLGPQAAAQSRVAVPGAAVPRAAVSPLAARARHRPVPGG
jgi:pyridoxamine 5'-phosphate oxidase family protein